MSTGGGLSALSTASSNELAGVYVIERDANTDLLAWAYPTLDVSLESVLKERSCLKEQPTSAKFFVSRFGNQWQYFITSPVLEEHGIEKVNGVSIVVLSDTYNVIKFRKVLSGFLGEYLKGKSTNAVLRPFIMAHANSITSKPTQAQQTEAKLALIAPVDALIEQLNLDSIAIWSAVATKQKVVLYHPDPEVISEFVRAAGCLGAWHRQTWTSLRPVCTDSAAEIHELKSLNGGFVAGFVSNCPNAQSIADLYIDLTRSTVVISDKVSKTVLSLTKYHKGVAESFVQTLEAVKAHNASASEQEKQDPSQAVLKHVTMKTKELLDQLKACKDESGFVSRESIRANGIPQNMENFLLAVASAEDMVKKT